MTDEPAWATWTISAIGGAGAVVAALIPLVPKVRKLAREVRQRRDKRTMLQNQRAFKLLSMAINRWRVRKGAQRVLLLDARNGGRPWPMDKPIRVSCLDQDVAEHTRNTWKHWQGWECDPSYRRLLLEVTESMEDSRGTKVDRGLLLVTEAMTDSTLRNAYLDQGTVASVVFGITWVPDENALLYASVNFGRQPTDDMPLTTEETVQYEQQARDLFNNPERIRVMAKEGREAWNLRAV